jgi:hypothetical protein
VSAGLANREEGRPAATATYSTETCVRPKVEEDKLGVVPGRSGTRSFTKVEGDDKATRFWCSGGREELHSDGVLKFHGRQPCCS